MATRRYATTTATLVCTLWCAVAFGQASGDDEDASGAEETESEMEEIVVIGEKPGDRQRLEVPYEDLMRERLLRELEAQRELEEEFEWRRGPRVEEPSRIRLGYRPQDANRDQRDTSLTDLPMENQKPATLFRFEF